MDAAQLQEFGAVKADLAHLKDTVARIEHKVDDLIETRAEIRGAKNVEKKYVKYIVPALMGFLAGGAHSAKAYIQIVSKWFTGE